MQAQRCGRIILLNGASSSGKTTLGRALQQVLPGTWFLFPVDALGAMRSQAVGGMDQVGTDEVLERTRRGYHRAVAGLVSAGNDVIMDYPLSEPWRLTDLLDVLMGVDVVLIDVHCSADELDRRESARGDRPLGLSRTQQVFVHDDRDIVVDTTSTDADTVAATIVRELSALAGERAFDRLRTRLRDQPLPGRLA
jgi:chloramphenicol 3-O phosphotransferase